MVSYTIKQPVTLVTVYLSRRQYIVAPCLVSSVLTLTGTMPPIMGRQPRHTLQERCHALTSKFKLQKTHFTHFFNLFKWDFMASSGKYSPVTGGLCQALFDAHSVRLEARHIDHIMICWLQALREIATKALSTTAEFAMAVNMLSFLDEI